MKPFDRQWLIDHARQLATQEFSPRVIPESSPLRQMTYDEYRAIVFNPNSAIWARQDRNFIVELFYPGFMFTNPIHLNVVQDGTARRVEFSPRVFSFWGEPAMKYQNEIADGYSGFRLAYPLNKVDSASEFLVFQGASYFRSLGRDQFYGLSARGLAVNTARPEGEEFPYFSEFWIEEPPSAAQEIVVHALLESQSVTGAYTFRAKPGVTTTIDVEASLFARRELTHYGLAPLTSMFLFDPSNRSRFDDFRPRAHDSDGLMFVSSAGEEVWRHLANPATLQISAFTSERPKAFGLMQRARLFSDFQDLEARYERRPSAWVEFPDEEGGPARGMLKLVEIPTRTEANDNIVAFWQPTQVLPAGQPHSGSYRLLWTAESLVERELGRFVATRIGANMRGDRRLVVLDLTGAGRSPEDLVLDVNASAGTVYNPVVHENPSIGGLRVSFEFDPGSAPLIEFRAQVREGEKPVSETWLYRWTAS